MKADGEYIAIEVKYQRSVDYRDILKHPKISKYLIISKEDIGIQGNVVIVPASIFLILLKKNKYNL